MSAPLVVNTTDGTCWTRREATRDGQPLYAMADCRRCPELVMATLAELAEHGIAGTADVLPVPAGPEMDAPAVDADRARAPWGRGEDGRPLLPMGAHWTDVPELVDRTVAGIQARLGRAHGGHWYEASATETWREPGTVCTRVDGVHCTVGLVKMLPADFDLVLHAHGDLSWCLDLIAKLRGQVAELEVLRAERDRLSRDLRGVSGTLDAVRGLLAESTPMLPGDGRDAIVRAVEWLAADRDARRRQVAELRARLALVHRTPQDSITPAEVRLGQYGERTKTWSTATYDSGTEKALYEIACALRETLEEVRDQRNAARLKVMGMEARVAELEAERHVTNESLSDTAEQLRVNRDRMAALERQLAEAPVAVTLTEKADGITRRIAPTQTLRSVGACSECGMAPEQWCKGCAKCACVDRHDDGCPEDVTPQVARLRALLAGQRAAVEDPHTSPLHHDYKVSRDLPTGGDR